MRKAQVGRNYYCFMEASEIVPLANENRRWMDHQQDIQRRNGTRPHSQFCEMASTGDYSLVEESEKFLRQIEDQVPVSRGWRNIDDVVGAIPNIPAFLAGHPQCMRRRERTMKDNAPLAIFMDLASSMGIDQKKILKRGIVLLALVRQLVEHRPVELWVGTSMGDGGMTSTAAWRIDTTPLDLARAAFHICDVSMSRLFGYATCEMLVNKHIGGFGHRDIKQVKEVAGWHEVLHVPAIHYTDPMVEDPVGWLKRTLAQYVQPHHESA
jgi:hypothetical protein